MLIIINTKSVIKMQGIILADIYYCMLLCIDWIKKYLAEKLHLKIEDFLFIESGSWFHRELALYLILLLP